MEHGDKDTDQPQGAENEHSPLSHFRLNCHHAPLKPVQTRGLYSPYWMLPDHFPNPTPLLEAFGVS